MTTITGVVRNQRIEVEGPINLPEGTVLTIPIPFGSKPLGQGDSDGADSPEAIEAWIRWYDALEPLDFTPAERAAWRMARQEQKDFELSQWDNRSKAIEGGYP